MFKEAMMKKFSAAAFLCLWILISLGCSSAPSGTVAIKDLKDNFAQHLGQNVVVVGNADTRTTLSSFKMIKIYKGTDSIFVSIPEGVEAPPRGVSIRVTGVVQQKEFAGLPGKTFFIESTKVSLE
jgi:hypothetical protein